MSLRLSSLDPNEPRAAKDCRTCNRRRIRCDRSLPTCKKCALKELTCPGYGLRIQWGQGVASRGKLSGKALPIIEPTPNPGVTPSASVTSDLFPSPGSSQSHTGSVGPPDEADLLRCLVRSPHHADDPFRNRFAIELEPDLSQLPRHLQTQATRTLLRYYDHVVASLMPWVDGPHNHWRTTMLPLAMQSPSLLLAILALSTEHYSAKTGSTWCTDDGTRAAHYRDQSLQLLAENLRTEAIEDAVVVREGASSAMLATILILCNVEMIRCDTSIWKVHWKAARTITRRWISPHHSSPLQDTTCRFLVKEAFVYDVFGSSTTFDDGGEIPGSIVSDQENDVFIEWLKLVQEVTRAERQRHAAVSDPAFVHLANLSVLQQRFEMARQNSLRGAAHLGFASPESGRDFATVVDIFHHAGLLYSYQALLDPRTTAADRANCLDEVIARIDQIQNRDAFQHDLVWPLFVVGTESRADANRQTFVDTRLREVMQSTGFSNCLPALQFLRRFWRTKYGVAHDWRSFARQEAKQGSCFLVI